MLRILMWRFGRAESPVATSTVSNALSRLLPTAFMSPLLVAWQPCEMPIGRATSGTQTTVTVVVPQPEG